MHAELQTLLQHRVDVIADRAFYERDSAAHLAALQDVSEKIQTFAETHNNEFDAKLRHFLANASYQKALAHLDQPA
jgi:hypothetical protein